MKHWLMVTLLCWMLCGLTQAYADERTPVRIGLTAFTQANHASFVQSWQHYLEKRLKRPVSFVQRGSYREVMVLLQSGKLDFAWLCGYPYITNTKDFRLLVVPVYLGKTSYQSYLIVPAADRQTDSIFDLKGKMFAFSDPDSSTGYLFPTFELRSLNKNPYTFFSESFFTWSQYNVIRAVASGLAQGGSVDGYVWDNLARQHPELTKQTRIVTKSPEFGFPPFVSRRSVDSADENAFRNALISMSRDAEGRELLEELNLDGFVPGNDIIYHSIAIMAQGIAE
jgi:phosphonate transport system substrate-binding protein